MASMSAMELAPRVDDSLQLACDALFAENAVAFEKDSHALVRQLRSTFESQFETCAWADDVAVPDCASPGLVRFRCMVQDMAGPELFLARLHLVSPTGETSHTLSTLFREETFTCPDGYDLDADCASEVTNTRHVFTVIPIPGETDWAARSARGAVDGNPGEHASPNHDVRARKRAFDGALIDDRADTMDCPGLVEKQAKDADNSGEAKQRERGRDRLPVRPTGKSQVHVFKAKIYDESAAEIRLNECLILYGVIRDAQSHHCNDETSETLPVFHALHWTRLANSGIAPSLPVDLLPMIHCELRDALKTVLCDDDLAAQYLACHLIANVYARREATPVGSLAVNLTGINGELVPRICQLLETFCEKFHVVAMSLENLNARSFVPVKDHDKDRLVSGLLQLANGTQLVLDETVLHEGQLTEIGYGNVSALRRVIASQTLDYDFRYHTMLFDCEINVLVLSEMKSVLQIAIPDAMRDLIGESFVKLRRSDAATDGTRLHQLLTIARLLSALDGLVEMDASHWELAQKMEHERLRRLASP